MRRYHSVITAAAIRVSRQWGNGTPDEIDDIVQEIYLKFCAEKCRILREFHATQQEAIFGFIKVIATNTARDVFRKSHAVKRGTVITQQLTEVSEQIGLSTDMDRTVFLSQLRQLLIAVTQSETGDRDRAIFQFRYRDDMTVDAISKMPGIELTPKGVDAVLHRLIKSMREVVNNPQETKAD